MCELIYYYYPSNTQQSGLLKPCIIFTHSTFAPNRDSKYAEGA